MSPSPRSFVGATRAFLSGSDPKYRDRTPLAILRLFTVVCMYYAVGVALIFWTPWRLGYQEYFRGLGNAAFEQFLIWPQASVHFLDRDAPDLITNIRAAAPPLTLPPSFPVPQRDRMMDTLMLLKSVDPQRPGLGQFRTSSHILGYWPLLTVLAFSLATPWSWPRRIWLLFLSLLLAHAFLAFRLAISLLQAGFADPDKSWRLVEIGSWWFARLKQLDSVINDNPVFSIIAPVFIWLIVVVGMELWPLFWNKLRAKLGSSRTLQQGRRHRSDAIPDFRRRKP